MATELVRNEISEVDRLLSEVSRLTRLTRAARVNIFHRRFNEAYPPGHAERESHIQEKPLFVLEFEKEHGEGLEASAREINELKRLSCWDLAE